MLGVKRNLKRIENQGNHKGLARQQHNNKYSIQKKTSTFQPHSRFLGAI